MQKRSLIGILALALLFTYSSILRAQATAKPAATNVQSPAPVPDLSGVWMRADKGQRVSFVQSDPSNKKGDNPPMTPWGEAKFKETRPAQGIRASENTNDPTSFVCLPPGVPRIYIEPHPVKIIQAPGEVVMLFEFNHYFRVIHTDGREHPKDLDPTWMGHAIGHWEADTLVVDTIGFNDKSWIDRAGHPHSDALHLVERIRRIDHETLQDDFTIDDPKAYTGPWTSQQVWKLQPTWDLLEDICEDTGSYADYQKKLSQGSSK